MKKILNQSGSEAKANFQKNKIINHKNLNRLFMIIILALGVFYIAGTNDLAIKGFALSDLKEQQARLETENKKLEINAMTLSSYNAVNEKVSKLKMVAAGDIQYINVIAETVAKK